MKKKLTVNQWKEIELKYESGNFTLDELSEQYSTPYRTIQSHLNKKGLTKGTSAGARSTKATAENYGEVSKRILCKLTDAIEEAIDDISPGQARASQIQHLTSAASKLFAAAEKAGLLSEEDNLPILQVIEITAAQIEEMRRKQRDENTELGLMPSDDDMPRDYEAEGIVIESFDDNRD